MKIQTLLVTLLICLSGSPVLGDQKVSKDPNDWPSYNHDNKGYRFNPAEKEINTESVANLEIKWRYTTCGPVHSTPAVVDEVIYAGDMCGKVYAVKENGKLKWEAQLSRFILGSAVVTDKAVIIGDMGGTMYALEKGKGTILWSNRPNPHPFAAIWGSPIVVDNKIIVGVGSLESSAPVADPNYPCCTFRGSLAAMDPDTGEVIWQTYFISPEDLANGSSGAGIWGIPTYDKGSKLLFIGTGNNLSPPATDTSDSLYALRIEDGSIVWRNQFTAGDFWNHTYLIGGNNLDADIGDSAKIYRLDGKLVVGAGDKQGYFKVLDAFTGVTLHEDKHIPGGLMGGFQTGMAFAYDRIFTNGVNWPDGQSPLKVPPAEIPPPTAGHVLALSKTGEEIWRFTIPGSVNASGVAVAGGVVFFESLQNGNLYALDAKDGRLLRKVFIGTSLSGPSVSDGRVYVGTGNLLFSEVLPFDPIGEIVSLGIDD